MTKEDREKNKINEKCDCCARDVDRDVLVWNSDIMKLSYLGSGFPMFFSFLNLTILLLIMVFCLAGILNILTNRYAGDQCSKRDDECKVSWLTTYSIGNKMDNYAAVTLHEVINLITVLALISYIQFLIKT